jgi:hypothetical protein
MGVWGWFGGEGRRCGGFSDTLLRRYRNARKVGRLTTNLLSLLLFDHESSGLRESLSLFELQLLDTRFFYSRNPQIRGQRREEGVFRYPLKLIPLRAYYVNGKVI